MKVTVDRIEEEVLVLITESGEIINAPLKLCPGAREGDIIGIEILVEETDKKRERISERFERLKNR